MVVVKIYIEGGGGRNNNILSEELREGFSIFFKNLGFDFCQAIPSDGCTDALKDFEIAINNLEKDEIALLLVDSDGYPDGKSEWDFLSSRKKNQLKKPDKADQESAFLMVQTNEAWLFSDISALKNFFGEGFDDSIFPSDEIERHSKKKIFDILNEATRKTTRGKYKKKFCFQILSEVDPNLIIQKSKYANRLFEKLKMISEKIEKLSAEKEE